MYWLDNDSGVTTPPAIPPVVSATRQYFTEGGAGEQPSIPGGEWFNMMTDEVLAVLAAANITPSKANHAQLLAALQAMFPNKAGDTMGGPLALAAGSTAPNPATGTRSTEIATMQKFADEFGSSVLLNGYQKFPSGLIVQWGASGGTIQNGGVGVTFPIVFPNAVYQILACTIGNSALASPATASSDLNPAGCTLWCTPAQTGVGIRYFVIGR